MNKATILMFLFFCGFLSPAITLGSYGYDSALRFDEATMSPDQREHFHSFLRDAGIDPLGYEHYQWCQVGVDKKISVDTFFNKFIQRCGLSEIDRADVVHEQASLEVRTKRFGDTMRMRCVSEPRDGINNLYVRIEVIPWRPGS